MKAKSRYLHVHYMTVIGICFQYYMHNGDTTEQCGHNEPILVEESNVKELIDDQAPTMTNAFTKLSIKIMARLKTVK